MCEPKRCLPFTSRALTFGLGGSHERNVWDGVGEDENKRLDSRQKLRGDSWGLGANGGDSREETNIEETYQKPEIVRYGGTVVHVCQWRSIPLAEKRMNAASPAPPRRGTLAETGLELPPIHLLSATKPRSPITGFKSSMIFRFHTGKYLCSVRASSRDATCEAGTSFLQTGIFIPVVP